MFSRIQNLHISQTAANPGAQGKKFSRIQNLHISQTAVAFISPFQMFSRIQNLHISQTWGRDSIFTICLVEFKIYISLKQDNFLNISYNV